MATILCLETATETCSVALFVDTKVIALYETTGQKVHAVQLNNFIAKVLELSGKSFKDLDAVAVSKGPGSYTGLRIGVASAKGICFGLDIPLIAVNTLQAMTANFLRLNPEIKNKSRQYFIPMIDARRDEVYTAMLDLELNFINETQSKILESNSFKGFEFGTDLHFFGSGAAKASEILLHEDRFFFYENLDASAAGLSEIVSEKYENSLFEDVAYFEPYYLKEFFAKLPSGQR